jgi:hypothetical protein
VDRTRVMSWIGVRRAVLRVCLGAAMLSALPVLAGLDLAEAGNKSKKKRRKRCNKQCKKAHKRCDRSCNELPDGDRDICKQDCKIAKKQCKKVC